MAGNHEILVQVQVGFIIFDLLFSFFVLYCMVVTFGGFIHKSKMYFTFIALMMISNNLRSIFALAYFGLEYHFFLNDLNAFKAAYPPSGKYLGNMTSPDYSNYLTQRNEVFKTENACLLYGFVSLNARRVRDLSAVSFLFEIASVLRIFDFQKWYCVCCGSWDRNKVRRQCYTKFFVLFVCGYALSLGLIWNYGRAYSKCGLKGAENGYAKYTLAQNTVDVGAALLAYVIMMVLSFNIFFSAKQKLIAAGGSQRSVRLFGLKFSFFLVFFQIVPDLDLFTYVIDFLKGIRRYEAVRYTLIYIGAIPATFNGIYLIILSKELRELIYRLCCCSAKPRQQDEPNSLRSALSKSVLSSFERPRPSSNVELPPSFGGEGSSLKQSLLQYREDGSL